MAKMTSQERMKRMYEHRTADRVPMQDGPWGSTIERWQREGLPKDTSWVDYFDLDKGGGFGVDITPRYPAKVIEETDTYTTYTTTWGATLRNWKHATSTPEFLDFTIVNPDVWREAKKRMTPTEDRIPWEQLKTDFPKWRQQGAWIGTGLWFGFDVTHAWIVGTERVLMALIDSPEWMVDMWNHSLDMSIALLDKVWDAGYHFDGIGWCDDLGYKHNQFMSLGMYRELLKPVMKRAVDWAHAKGLKVELHSCGDVNPFVPEFIEIGIDGLNPLEVKAGMDPYALKKKFGDKLVFHGGLNAVIWDDVDAVEAEMKRLIPVMKQNGGYVFASDHSIPDSVSFANFKRIVELYKKLGSYE
jgi:uroporphyrinogen decarboxylase